MTHSKKLNLLLNLLIICISTRSALQILSIKDDSTFRFLNFLIFASCNSSANCHVAKSIGRWLSIILILTVPQDIFLSKKL